jgi:hypothetical protein
MNSDDRARQIILHAIIESENRDGYGNPRGSIVGSIEDAKTLRENIFLALKEAGLLKIDDESQA